MFEYIHSSFPERKHSPENTIFSKMKSSLKWSLYIASHVLNTFTLHFPNENVLQGTQSSLKWSLLWNSWPSLNCLFDRPSIWIFFIFELVVVFELVIVFELFDRPSTLSSLNSLSSSNSSNSLIQLTLRLAVFLRHTTFQAIYMQFGTVNSLWASAVKFRWDFLLVDGIGKPYEISY